MWGGTDSNRQPIDYEPTALTIELPPLKCKRTKNMLGMGIEPMLGPHLGHTVYKTVGASSYTNPAKDLNRRNLPSYKFLFVITGGKNC